jgi:hypothetical protein
MSSHKFAQGEAMNKRQRKRKRKQQKKLRSLENDPAFKRVMVLCRQISARYPRDVRLN